MGSREVERKFLVAALPETLDSGRSDQVRQGYIAVGADGTEVRVRSLGGRFFETIKSGKGRSRFEEEVEITGPQFEALWRTTEGKRLEKTRYYLPLNRGLVAELDIFAGSLQGLVTVEVEFKTEEEASAFEAPGWFGREITEDDQYKNQSLAIRGKPT